MTVTSHVEAEVFKARRYRQRIALDTLDYQREVAYLNLELKVNQSELSRQLGVSQPTIHNTLKQASKLPPVKEGFAGATPYEIAQRYAVGEISRDQLIEQLTRWEYVRPPEVEHDFFDDLRFDTPGSVDDVVRAFDHGLIDGGTYDTILDALSEDSP